MAFLILCFAGQKVPGGVPEISTIVFLEALPADDGECVPPAATWRSVIPSLRVPVVGVQLPESLSVGEAGWGMLIFLVQQLLV